MIFAQNLRGGMAIDQRANFFPSPVRLLEILLLRLAARAQTNTRAT